MIEAALLFGAAVIVGLAFAGMLIENGLTNIAKAIDADGVRREEGERERRQFVR